MSDEEQQMSETRSEVQARLRAERAARIASARAYNATMMRDIQARARANEILHRVTLADFHPTAPDHTERLDGSPPGGDVWKDAR
jgi:hypothetical protein